MKSFLSLVAFAITCAELAYWLGRQLRQTLDTRNDQPARWWVSVLGVGPVADPAPVVAPETPAVAPVAARTPRARKAAAAPVAAPAAPVVVVPPPPARRARKRRAVEVVAA
jgi:hypothetical protein